jgi:hypothetical protein
MEQTDVTVATNSLTRDTDQPMELRKSQINLLSGTVDDSNFYLNEVGFFFVLFIEKNINNREKQRKENKTNFILYVNLSKELIEYKI